MNIPARGAASLAILMLSGCHLVDQRDFDRRAGAKPEPPAAPAVVVKGPKPLLLIDYRTPDPDYAPALQAAVQRALALKPGVLFSVQMLVPPAPTPDAQAAAQLAATATGREIAEAIVTDGADPGQVELAVRGDPGVTAKQARIYVH
jgi:hypothetical protein